MKLRIVWLIVVWTAVLPLRIAPGAAVGGCEDAKGSPCSGCGEDSPGMPGVSDAGEDEGFAATFPIGPSIPGWPGPELTWQADAPADGVAIASLSYPAVACDSHQAGNHLQVKAGNSLVDVSEGDDQLDLAFYGPDPVAIPSGPFQGQFVDLSGLTPTKTISFSFQDPALHVTLTANGQPRIFQLTYDAGTATRTWTDEAAGYKFSAAFAVASATERLVTTEELRGGTSGWQVVSRVQDTWRNRVPEPGIELYQLEERVLDPGGDNLTTSYRYLKGVVVRQIEPSGAWLVRSRMNTLEQELKLLVPDTQGELIEVEDSNFPNAYVDGIQSVEYRGWLDAAMPAGVPNPANCTASVEKQESVLIDGQWLWRTVTETWTAGYCSGKSDSVTKPDGQTVTRTWSAQGQYLVREDGPSGTTNEDGTIRRLAAYPGDYTPAGGFQQNTTGEYLQTIEWDDGPVCSQQPSSAVMEVRIEDPSGRLIERKLHPCLPNGNYDAQTAMLTETWTTPIEAPGEVWHFKNGILCGRSSADESASETFEQTAGSPEIRTQRDASGRVESITGQYAVPVVTTYSFDGRKEIVTRSAGGLSEVSITERDVAGRIIATTDQHGITSSISYSNHGRTVTTVRPGDVTEVATSYLDGQRKSLTGSGVVPVCWEYAVDANGFLATTEYLGSGDNTSERFTITRTDWRGRTVAVTRPNPAGDGTVTEGREYSPTTGHLTKITNTFTGTGTRITADRLFTHDPLGRVNRSGLDLGAMPDGDLTEASPDRLTTTLREYVNTDGRWWDQTTTRALRTANDANAAYETIERIALAPVNENDAGRWTTVAILPGGLTWTTERVESLAGGTVEVRTDSNATTASPDQTQVYVGERLASSAGCGAAQAFEFTYDALGRRTLVTDPRGGVTRTGHDASGRVTEMTDHLGNTTTVDYHPPGGPGAGLVWHVTNPEREVTEYHYDLHGRVQEVTGNGTYRRSFNYNMYGDLLTLTTYAAGGGGQTTTWERFPASGLVHEKIYPDGKRTTYSYHADGRVATRTWARLAGGQPLVTTYQFHPSGELSKILYSDLTPAVEILVDRLGRPTSVTDGGGTTGIVYLPEAPLLSAENYPAGHAWLPNVSILQGWDPAKRWKGVVNEDEHGAGAVTWVDGEKVFDATAHHVYDEITGRLAGVARRNGTFAHLYGYVPGTDLIKEVVHQNQGTSQTIATEFRRHDGAGRLYAIETRKAGGTTLQRHSYRHDAAGRRTRASREDGAYWAYGYNERGEVVSGKKHLPDGSPLAGQQFEYEFDGLGNRLSAKSGGDQNGQGLRSITYTPNALNQYEEIDTPGSFDVIGRAPAGEVTVNSAPALRQGARFRAEVSADNSARSVWQQVIVAPPQGQPVEGHRYLPKQEVHPLHDDDGNLTFDGRWDYVWDAENRLISMTTKLAAQAVGEPFRKLVFDYDWLGRRLRKRIFDSPSATDPIEDLRFAYDGWNMVAEYRVTPPGGALVPIRTYLWGTDISGTPQGAGGVGGLLSARAGGAEFAASYDGNGNIIGWIDAGGSLACRQEYDPFGNLIAREGSVEIPVGFSTKYRDRETGLIYYIFRYYDPVSGRWRSRDPIGERGGVNLYEFVGNSGINSQDSLGLKFEQHKTRHVRALPRRSPGEATGVTPHRAIMRIGCKCDREDGKWWPELEAFLVQAYVLVRTHLRYHGKDFELTEEFQQNTLTHENKHVENVKAWHDAALPLAKREFSKQHKFDGIRPCSEYINSREFYWVDKYATEVQDAEREHLNGPYPASSGLLGPEHFVNWNAGMHPMNATFDRIPDDETEHIGFNLRLSFFNTTPDL